MTYLEKPAIVVPRHQISQSQMLEALRRYYAHTPRLESLLRLAQQTTVETRHFVCSLEELFEQKTLTVQQERYTVEATRLAMQAVSLALSSAREEIGIREQDVTHLIVVSCTSPGVLLPGLDARIANTFAFSPFLRRLPVSQMGCHAGAMALAQAHDYVTARPDAVVLIVAVELPSCNNQPPDAEPGDFVSRGLFGDGCAALLAHNRASSNGGYRIVDTAQHLVPNTLAHMQYLNDERGNHFSTNKAVVSGLMHGFRLIHAFVEQHGLRASDLDFIVAHTGGPRVLDAVRDGLGIGEEMLKQSRASLREQGNLSSVSVLDVLSRSFHDHPAGVGLLLGFGPGSTIEMVLLERG